LAAAEEHSAAAAARASCQSRCICDIGGFVCLHAADSVDDTRDAARAMRRTDEVGVDVKTVGMKKDGMKLPPWASPASILSCKTNKTPKEYWYYLGA
jgi:hypothetical protein